jgi:hypothetical protein
MNNRFDEMVLDAVDGIDKGKLENDKPSSRKAKNIVSISSGDEAQTMPPTRKRRRGKNLEVSTATLARELTRAHVTKTVRFRPDVAEALNNIVLQNKCTGAKPDTIQDVVNEAVSTWLDTCQPARRHSE